MSSVSDIPIRKRTAVKTAALAPKLTTESQAAKMAARTAQARKDSVQASRKRGVVASFPGDSIGARVAAKNAALAAIGEEEDAMDPAVDTAMEDLVGMLQGTSIGGRRRLRGGGPTAEAIGHLFSGLKAKAASVGGTLDAAVATLVNNLGTVGAVGGTVAVLNHPSVIGNMAQLFAEVLKQGSPAVITSTWSQWSAALGQLASAASTVVETAGAQTAQGPVVPVAIAVLVTMIRGNKSGRSFADVLKDDASALASGAAYVVTGQIQAATEAYGKEAAAKGIRQLKELAGRVERPRGPGVVALDTGVPAARGGPAGIGLVAASPGAVSRIPAAARNVANAASAPGPDYSAAVTLAGLADRVQGEDDMKEGGRRRRKTKKRASKKRRATRRQPVFVY
jgi:hypothetical protein